MELALFHVLTEDRLLSASSRLVQIPNLAHTVSSNRRYHRWHVAAEIQAGQRLCMTLELKHRPLRLPGIVTAEVATLSADAEMVFTLVVPIRAFNVLMLRLVQVIRDSTFFLTHVDDVDDAVVATREEDLLVLAIPADHLNFVCVEVLIGHFAGKLINIPDPHGTISR